MSARGKWTVFVDVVGGCNLRCPSCPVGNSSTDSKPHGLMSNETMELIAEKAVRELGAPRFYLFNWAEPFLHPKLYELVKILKNRNIPVAISTNGNVSRNVDRVMAAGPDTVIVSVSGFEQENYGQTHKRGDIERVKTTMRLLAQAKAALRAETLLTVRFHRYLANRPDELAMREFATSLCFEFAAGWAYFMPLEKIVALAEGGLANSTISEDEHDLIARLALDPLEALTVARRYRNQPCLLIDRSLPISFNGDILLCCATYDANRFGVGNYLDKPIAELQLRRENHSFCASCVAQGGHIYANNQAPEFDDIAIARVRRLYPEIDPYSLGTYKPRGWRKWARKMREIVGAKA